MINPLVILRRVVDNVMFWNLCRLVSIFYLNVSIDSYCTYKTSYELWISTSTCWTWLSGIEFFFIIVDLVVHLFICLSRALVEWECHNMFTMSHFTIFIIIIQYSQNNHIHSYCTFKTSYGFLDINLNLLNCYERLICY